MSKTEVNRMQFLLISWFASDKISLYLYDLLMNHLLVFDVKDRCKSCQDLINHPWFYSYIKQNRHKYQSFDIVFDDSEEGETHSLLSF